MNITDENSQDAKYIPYLIIGFFVLFIGILSVMTYVATHHYSGVMTKETYRRGLDYNETLAKAAKQEALGWKGSFTYTVKEQRANIIFMLRDKQNAPISDASVIAVFFRPTQQGNDVRFSLTSVGDGKYVGTTTLAWQGQWQVTISATKSENNYQLQRDIMAQ